MLQTYILILLLTISCDKENKLLLNDLPLKKTAYYFSVNGNDKNDGSLQHPLQTVNRLNSIKLIAGDTIFLKAGDVFKGTINIQPNTTGNAESSILITSYGKGNAIIDAENNTAITLNHASFITIKNINCKGIGRKNGNTENGIAINSCNYISIENTDVSGFQKAGLLIYCSNNITAEKVMAYDNGFAGISILGIDKKDDCSNIHIANCNAINNPGDPTNFTNHSGNGIIAGFCKKVLIEYCTASNNGWDMPRIGNGPVGIWCYEADSVIIQHCISYKNKTATGADDGGGYDFDGGTTNSVIQYCLSYENYGSAFGIFQYAGASVWANNIIRFCISENDGKVSAAHAAVYIWNSSDDASQFKNLLFYNNTIYNDSNAAIHYSTQNKRSNFRFYNNIFVAADEIIKGNYNDDIFLANDWWSLKNSFNVNGNYNFKNWCITNNKEQLNDAIKGVNILPSFKNPGKTTLTVAGKLNSFNNYFITASSPATQSGIALQNLYNINTNSKDFNGNLININYLGACTRSDGLKPSDR